MHRAHARRVVPAAAWLVALSLGAWLGAAPGARAQTPARIATTCDRACLEGVVRDYLAAVVAHDPSRLPLSADVRYTENEQPVPVGEGFWRTASGVGNYAHHFADPETLQAAWMGTVKEGSALVLMALRLRVQLGRITEIETSYFRPGGGGPNDVAGLDARRAPEALWLEPIPPAQRSTRHELVEIANAYFDGVQRNDGKGFYPFADDCDRIENGARTTNSPGGPTTPGGFNYLALDCKKQLESGYLAIVTSVHQRRYPLVDEQRGVVWSNAIFDLGGTVSSIRLTSGETVDTSAFAGRASSIEITEAFKIEHGKIRRIEMVGGSVPYHLHSAWGGLSGR
jgi:hypothetical protein